ncbi:MAG: hypothetical protein QF363_10650, partial [Planctomycetaceae bacterium]|nr:hypothetical protein [Planctomycetaceae bacterium]
MIENHPVANHSSAGPEKQLHSHRQLPVSPTPQASPTGFEPGDVTSTQSMDLRAGVEPWSNPFRNLRSTRETELALEHPLHIVCEWIGNTPSVAMSNYLRVTDADYERALTKDSALQNALQQPAAGARKASQPKMTNPTKPADCKALRESAARCEG